VPTVIAGSDAVQPTSGGDLGLPASGGKYAPSVNGTLLLSVVQYNDANGAHGTPLYTPGAIGSGTVSLDSMSEVALYNGAGAAVYEVMDANPNVQESVQLPTFLSLAPITNGIPVETSEEVSLAPLSTVDTATVKDPIARFEEVTVPPDCTIVGDCNARYFPRLHLVESSLNYTAPTDSSYQVNYIQVQNVSGGVMRWITSLKYLNGDGWLRLFPTDGVGGATIRVDALPGTLTPATYNAILTIDAGPVAGSADVPISLVITPNTATPVVQSIVNAATLAAGSVAPGSIAAVFGTNLKGQNVTVTFDDIPGQVSFDGTTQINVPVPASLGGKNSTQVVVTVDGNVSAPFIANLAPFAPGIFGILNHDNTVNSAKQPAAPGTTIQIFATGLAGNGVITGRIGAIAVNQPYYAGLAPGLPGVQQVNLPLPGDLTGTSVQVAVCGGPSVDNVVCSPTVAVALAQQ